MTSRAGPLVEILEAAHQHGGNPGYPALAMLSACVMQFTLREPYANGFIDRLGGNERLLEICGLPRAPSKRAYSRFKKKLTNHVDLIQHIIADVFLECGTEIERLREAGIVPADKPPLGESLVMDSTDVEAWARPGRKSRKTGEDKPSKDPDAQWGHRTAKNPRSSKPRSSRQGKSKSKTPKAKGDGKDSKDELYFGYKVDVIADSNHGLPLFAATRPANASDVTVMVRDLDDCLALYRMLDPKYLLADKGYDKLDNILHIINRGMIPVVAVRLPQKDKETGLRLHDGTYVEDGRLLCNCGKAMDYIETDTEWGHLFRCPAEGCSHERYVKPEGRLLRMVGLLPRCSEEWKGEYKKRPIIERFFSSDKHSRMLDTHRYLNGEKVELHVMMSMLSYLATALAHLKANDYAHMRHMRIKLQSARGASRNRGQSPRLACHDPKCDCCARWREAA